jgi:hypothetical protein
VSKVNHSPRIGVSLPQEVYALYKAFAELSGTSMSAMLREIAVTSAPALERVVRVALAAKQADQARKEGLRQAFSEAEEQLRPLVSQVESTLGLSLDGIERAVSAQSRPTRTATAAKRVAAGRTPVPVIRGSGTPRKGKGRRGR